ncbi:hypothetical protein [Falsiroseomonas sp. HW251]|uniref:hypothetical protein n=1 Tax=Falsiroseomonas sp. HW251 TaxID=3390998 RepID=UPI003D3179F7
MEQLHRATALPKPTIMRLLGTLGAAGLVAKGTRGIGYHVTRPTAASRPSTARSACGTAWLRARWAAPISPGAPRRSGGWCAR